MGKARGAIVWEGPSPVDGSPIVMIVTGLQGKASANRKTGEMVQAWILRADIHPLEAIRLGSDDAICGDCPLRGTNVNGKRAGRACYVNVGQAPASIYRAYRRGAYPVMAPQEVGALIEGKAIRLGAYGDPAMVPIGVLDALTVSARLWTGYTHQWRTIDPAYGRYLMASADKVSDRREARAQGYRSFYVVPMGGSAKDITGSMECANTRARNPLQCADCGACAGTRRGTSAHAVDVAIVAHGTGAKYVSA